MNRRFAIAFAVVLATAISMPTTSSAAVRSSQSGWAWGSPRPQGNNLNALDFAGGRGYAVGDFGTIVRTDDGGANWSGVKSGLTTDLAKLRVVDADTFFAGGGCTLLRSTDRGQTLRTLRFNPSASCGSPLATLHFPSRDLGYLFRADNSVLRTDDGGARFAARMAVPGTGGGPPNDAFFTSENGVVVTGTDTLGKIFRTTDGGNSWSEEATSQALRGVHFVSATTGYAVGQSSVLKTTDGGDTWDAQPAPPQPLRSVRCADEMHCVVVTLSNVVLFTADGFATLEAATTPTPGLTGVTALAAGYNSATRAVAVGGNGVTWLSDDAGASFLRAWATFPQNYRRLRLTSPSVATAPGAGGAVARTTDSGASWTSVGAPTNGADVVDVSFPTSDLGYAVDSQGAVFRTDNGGGSWAILGEARSGVRPLAMTASGDGNRVMLFGPTGALRSANAGENFDTVEDPNVAKARLQDVDRAGGAVFAYGTRAILATTNEGASWAVVKRPRGSLQDLDFVDANTGFALTTDGRVWRTANRGRSWTDLFTLGRSDGYELAFGDRNNGYLAIESFLGAGDVGWVLRTKDGGKSWHPQVVERNQIATDGLAAAPGSVAYALVPGADFFRTDVGGDLGAASTLTITTKTRRLRRKGKVAVTGKVSPAAAGERIEVGRRQFNSAGWQRQTVTVRSDGTFTTNWSVSRTSYFVAQWDGDQQRAGDGSGALRVVVAP